MNFFKIVFLREIYFIKDIISEFSNNLKIVGISNTQPIYIGGYEMQNKSGNHGVKSMYKGYAAGTTLLIKPTQNLNQSEIIDELNQRLNNIGGYYGNNYIII